LYVDLIGIFCPGWVSYEAGYVFVECIIYRIDAAERIDRYGVPSTKERKEEHGTHTHQTCPAEVKVVFQQWQNSMSKTHDGTQNGGFSLGNHNTQHTSLSCFQHTLTGSYSYRITQVAKAQCVKAYDGHWAFEDRKHIELLKEQM